MMTKTQEATEKTLDQIQEILAEVQRGIESARLSIQRCEEDNFPRLPLIPLYRRPKFTDSDC